jgi:two-component system alkaline phosphatase synthesis response regulator PhoP
MPPRILIVDNDPVTRQAMERVLSQEGFRVVASTNGREAMAVAAKADPDLMVVNLDLADLHGDNVCQMIRQMPEIRATPLLVLSGDDVDGLSIRCLNQGADGYLVKPINSQELLAHMRAILRRPRLFLSENTIVRKGRITMRLGERMVLFDGKAIKDLTPKEYEILKELVLRSPRVLEKHGLVIKIWGIPFEQLGRRTLDVHIQRLRRKLGPPASSHLKTIPLVGYQWANDTRD